MKFRPMRLRSIAIATAALVGMQYGTAFAATMDIAASDAISARSGAVSGYNWREENAYTLGVQAYAVGFPWIHLSKIRWRIQNVKPTGDVDGMIAYAPLRNTIWQASRLPDYHARTGVMPNADTAYGVGWLNVGKEPVIVTVPKVSDNRYYTIEFSSIDGDNFAYVGTRTTGQVGGDFAVVGPDWHGKLPAGVKQLPASHTPWVLVGARILVSGNDDFVNVKGWQQHVRVTPLSQWGNAHPPAPQPTEVFKPGDPRQDPLADFRTLNKAWAENPPPARLAPLLAMFKDIGIGPGLDLDKVDADTRRGLERAAADGMRMVAANAHSPERAPISNGWQFAPHEVGHLGDKDMYLERAGLVLSGLIWNDEPEAIYVHGLTDSQGNLLDGANGRYVMHFAAGEKVPAKAFWSVSMYGLDYNFTQNQIDRSTIGDRTHGLKRDPDGGLTIYIQHESPGADKESNWLPAPKTGFYLLFRGYLPEEPLRAHEWIPPAITRVGGN
jgi:hypothetical protein